MATKNISGELGQRLLEDDAYTVPCTEQEELSSPAALHQHSKIQSERNKYKQQRRPTTCRLLTGSDSCTTCSAVRVEVLTYEEM